MHTLRPLSAAALCLSLLCVISNVSAADKPAQPAEHAVRRRFVPPAPGAEKSNHASFSALHQFVGDDPGVLMLMAHAGIGDSFPVAEENKPKVFEVKVVAGDDALLRLEIRTDHGADQYDLKRDGKVQVMVSGQKFTFSYPSVTVSSVGKATADTAMIIVNRLP